METTWKSDLLLLPAWSPWLLEWGSAIFSPRVHKTTKVPSCNPCTWALKHPSHCVAAPWPCSARLQLAQLSSKEAGCGLGVHPLAFICAEGETWHGILLQLQGCAGASSILSSRGLMSSFCRSYAACVVSRPLAVFNPDSAVCSLRYPAGWDFHGLALGELCSG